MAIDSSEFSKNKQVVKKLDSLLVANLPEAGTKRIHPQRLLADTFDLAELRELGKWVKASDYEPFLNGLLSLRFGDFTTGNITLIVGAIDEGISENILDATVGGKLKSLLSNA